MTRNEINEGRSWNGDLVTPTLDQENLELAEQALAEARAARSQREEVEKDFEEVRNTISEQLCPIFSNNFAKELSLLRGKNKKLAETNNNLNEQKMKLYSENCKLRRQVQSLSDRIGHLESKLYEIEEKEKLVDMLVAEGDVQRIDMSTMTIEQAYEATRPKQPGLTTTPNPELTKAEGQQAVKEAVKEILDLFDKYKFLFK